MLLKALFQSFKWLLGLIMVFIMVLTTLNVVLRFFGASFVWGEELIRFSMIWIVFLGAGVLVYNDKHITMDMIFSALPAKLRHVVSIIISIIALITGAALSVISGKVVWKVAMLGQKSPAGQVPVWIVYISLFVGFVLMSIMYLRELVLLVKQGKEVEKETKGFEI